MRQEQKGDDGRKEKLIARPFLLLVMEKYREQILHNSPEAIRSGL